MMLDQNNNTDEFPFSELIKLLKNNPDCFSNLVKKAYIILSLDMLFYIAVSFLALGIFTVIVMVCTKIFQYIRKRQANKNAIKT